MSSEIVFVLFCIEECSSYMLVRNKVYVVLITGLEYYRNQTFAGAQEGEHERQSLMCHF